MALFVLESFVLVLGALLFGVLIGFMARRTLSRPLPAGPVIANFAPEEAAPAQPEGPPSAGGESAFLPDMVPATSSPETSATSDDPQDAGGRAVAPGIIDPDRAAGADQVGARPAALLAARGGQADDLKRIRGIGPQNEARLNSLGIYHFDQIAAWSPEEARWVGSYLAFPGRIEREDWVIQAQRLATAPA